MASIPAARHNNISPLRSSLDNLATVFFTSKNSFSNTPIAITGNKMGSKKQSVPKVVIANGPQGGSTLKDDMQLYFVDNNHAETLP